MRCPASCRERDRSVVRVSRAIAEWTAYRSAVPGAAAVPTASAERGRREVPREWSSTRSVFSGWSGCSPPPTTEEAGAGRSLRRCTSAVRRAARRPAHSGAAAATAPEASYSAAQPSTCAASAASSPSGPSVSAFLVSSRWAAKPAVTARYWSAAIAAETALLMARKGVRRGTSSSGSPSLRAASTSASGISS